MNKLTATFANGKTITRNSKTAFAFAWYAENIWNRASGFASSADNAKKAAGSAFCSAAPKPHIIEVVQVSIA